MRSFLPQFELRAAANLTDALEVLASAQGRGVRSPAGPTSWCSSSRASCRRASTSACGVCRSCAGIEVTDDEIVVGGLTTYSELLRSEALQAECPLLCRAAAEVGGVATQNRGTIGGNIVNASPAADAPPALLVYDADVQLVSLRGTRVVPTIAFTSATRSSISRRTSCCSACVCGAAAAAGCRRGARSARAGRRRSRRCASLPRSSSPATPCMTFASPWAAWRRRLFDRLAPSQCCAGGRLRLRQSARRARRSFATFLRLTTSARRRSIGSASQGICSRIF